MNPIKIILSLIIFWNTVVYSQDSLMCSKYISKTVDKVEGTETWGSTDFLTVERPEREVSAKFLWVRLSSSTDVNILSIYLKGVRDCIDEKGNIKILFRDQSKLSIKSDNEFNCKGNAVLRFGNVFGKLDEMNQFASKDIEIMRIATRGSSIDIEFSENDSKALKNTLQCLLNLTGK